MDQGSMFCTFPEGSFIFVCMRSTTRLMIIALLCCLLGFFLSHVRDKPKNATVERGN